MTFQDIDRCGSVASPTSDASNIRRGMLGRIIDAIVLSGQCRADSEVARYFGIPGGRFNDEVEHSIMRHITRNLSFRP